MAKRQHGRQQSSGASAWLLAQRKEHHRSGKIAKELNIPGASGHAQAGAHLSEPPRADREGGLISPKAFWECAPVASASSAPRNTTISPARTTSTSPLRRSASRPAHRRHRLLARSARPEDGERYFASSRSKLSILRTRGRPQQNLLRQPHATLPQGRLKMETTKETSPAAFSISSARRQGSAAG